MKLKIISSIFFILPISISYANTPDTPVAVNSQQVCENRINAFKKALQSAIDAKQNVDASKAELAQINKIPSTLPPCERQKLIPAFSEGEGIKQENKSQDNRNTTP